jgi:hypothetical protein
MILKPMDAQKMCVWFILLIRLELCERRRSDVPFSPVVHAREE